MSSETPYAKWYAKNKERLNKARKARYASDPEHREELLEQRRQRRRENPEPSRAGLSRMKVVNGVLQETFRISVVADQIGRSAQTIRLWETKGLIPTPANAVSKHRFYTHKQVVLLRELADLIQLTRHGSPDVYAATLAYKCDEIKTKWSEN